MTVRLSAQQQSEKQQQQHQWLHERERERARGGGAVRQTERCHGNEIVIGCLEVN